MTRARTALGIRTLAYTVLIVSLNAQAADNVASEVATSEPKYPLALTLSSPATAANATGPVLSPSSSTLSTI